MYDGKRILWTAAIALVVVVAYNHVAASRGGAPVSLRRAA